MGYWAGSSVVERIPDKNEVHGSIPCPPTSYAQIYNKKKHHNSCGLDNRLGIVVVERTVG